jgi:hypothetical protein
MSALPILVQWDGDAFLPAGSLHKQRANERFVVGERYTMDVLEQRSAESHRHYFAAINEAWKNLPEQMAERLPSAEHLRKFALVKAGFRDERSITCSSKAEANRLAVFIRPCDDFAVVTVVGSTVTMYTAKSQSMRAMGKRDFAASKDAVLDVIARMIGTSAEDLAKAGEAA